MTNIGNCSLPWSTSTYLILIKHPQIYSYLFDPTLLYITLLHKILQPAKLDLDINLSADGNNGTSFTHWKTQMTHYIDSIKPTADTQEL